jgi:hypothetical protein
MDASVTPEAFVEMLLALRDREPFAPDSERLARIYAAYRSACDHTATLQARLERLADPNLMENAAMRAKMALPPQARLEATVYLLPDGRSPGYAMGNVVVLDLLQISDAREVEATLAHELHHVGTSSLLPEPCSEPGLEMTLETLVDMAQEGAATYWVDGWHAVPTQADLELVGTFLRDALSEQSDADKIMARKAELMRGWRGPLYRVGNAMIATLTTARGDDWVQAHLGDPVGLLRAWQQEIEPGSPFDQEVQLFLERAEAQGKCPAWLPTPEAGRTEVPTVCPRECLFDTRTASESSVAPEERLFVTARQGGAAQQVVLDFLQAVVDGDVEQALSYWNLEQPDMPDNYAESVRQWVTEWATGEDRFTVGLTSYGGLVAPGDYRTLDEDDPRVQQALVNIYVGELEYSLSLEIVDGRWQIEGLMTP